MLARVHYFILGNIVVIIVMAFENVNNDVLMRNYRQQECFFVLAALPWMKFHNST